MDLTYREPVTTYSDRSGASRMAYREPQDTGDVLRLARDIDVPAPLRVGAGELVVVIGEADAVVGRPPSWSPTRSAPRPRWSSAAPTSRTRSPPTSCRPARTRPAAERAP